MPRQPFRPLYRKHPRGQISIGPQCLGRRPELESLIAHSLIQWPIVDAQMALLIGRLIGVHHSAAAMAVFDAMRRSQNQRNVVAIASETSVNIQHKSLLDAILKVHKSIEAERNALAHGYFGVYSKLPDDLIWMETKSYLDFRANHELRKLPHSSSSVEAFIDKIFVYNETTLKSIKSSIFDLIFIFDAFVKMLDANASQQAQQYDLLCLKPQIREALESIGRGSSQKEPDE